MQLNGEENKSGLFIEKPKLDNARRLWYLLIEPADAEFKETLENALRKLEVPMPAAMLCKIRRGTFKETCRNPDRPKTQYACIVEADESTRKRLEGTLHKDHEDNIAGTGINSLNHHNLVRKFILLPQAMLDAITASALKNLINTQSNFRKRVSVEEKRAQIFDRFLRRRQIAHMLYECFRPTGAYEAAPRTRRPVHYEFAE